MPLINENFLKLKAGYLFPEIGRRVKAHAAANPGAKIIRLGIGDVTEPLPPAVVGAMHKALDEMAVRESFRGYGPEQGYDFLRDAIAANDFKPRNAEVSADEIFVSDGSKCDCGNVLDILGTGNAIAVTDPVYPVYVDTNVMAGNTVAPDANGEYPGLVYLRCTAGSGFTPSLPTGNVDVIYLCSPNNPTGAVLTRDQLTQWVNYAKANDALILFDAAYEAFNHRPVDPAQHLRDPRRAGNARSSSAASARRPASPACARRSRSCRRRSPAARPMGNVSRFTTCGCDATPRSSMA